MPYQWHILHAAARLLGQSRARRCTWQACPSGPARTCGCTSPPCHTSCQMQWDCTLGSTEQRKRWHSATSARVVNRHRGWAIGVKLPQWYTCSRCKNDTLNRQRAVRWAAGADKHALLSLTCAACTHPVGCIQEVVRVQQQLLKHLLACLPA